MRRRARAATKAPIFRSEGVSGSFRHHMSGSSRSSEKWRKLQQAWTSRKMKLKKASLKVFRNDFRKQRHKRKTSTIVHLQNDCRATVRQTKAKLLPLSGWLEWWQKLTLRAPPSARRWTLSYYLYRSFRLNFNQIVTIVEFTFAAFSKTIYFKSVFCINHNLNSFWF